MRLNFILAKIPESLIVAIAIIITMFQALHTKTLNTFQQTNDYPFQTLIRFR
jgi:hypothetical protein